jgi:hypothetical protein
MPDERTRIIDRANRVLQQSRTLRRLANELQQESRDLKSYAKRAGPAPSRQKGAKKR